MKDIKDLSGEELANALSQSYEAVMINQQNIGIIKNELARRAKESMPKVEGKKKK